MNARASFITGTSGAEKLLGINSGGLAECTQLGSVLTAFSEVALFRTRGFYKRWDGPFSIEASPFVGLKGGAWGGAILLMQLKMVLEDIIADMYKVIRELWLFWHSP